MHADQFESRLAIVRHRFATTLESKITDVVVSTDRMSRSDDGAIEESLGIISSSAQHLRHRAYSRLFHHRRGRACRRSGDDTSLS